MLPNGNCAQSSSAGYGVQADEVGVTVKKLLVLIAAAVGGFAIFRKVTNDRAEQDLWNEAVSDSDAPVVDLR